MRKIAEISNDEKCKDNQENGAVLIDDGYGPKQS